MTNITTVQQLKILLADTYVLYLKTQYYHWNVQGSYFYSFHKMFEDQYEELAEAVDEIAERIRARNEFAPGTMKDFLSLKTGSEGKSAIDAFTMIKDLADSHLSIADVLRDLIDFASEEGDDVSQDLAIKRLEYHEKTAWMLNSHIIGPTKGGVRKLSSRSVSKKK